MAAPSATDELRALELARSRLAALLAGDENWRALTQPVADGAQAESAEAHRARTTRLEMALADNELYQAWKHLDDAITVLRAKRAGARPRPEAVADAGHGPPETQDQVAAKAAAQAADALSRVPARLMRRLEAMQPQPAAAASAAPAARPAPTKRPKAERRAAPAPPEPDEATGTFVVRAPPGQHPPSAEPAEVGMKGDVAPSGQLRRVGDVPEGDAFSPAGSGGEEAEVTIFSPDGAREHREAEERANIVRRFRKALSGD